MPIHANFHKVEKADSFSHEMHSPPFDSMTVTDADGSYVSLFLPLGAGQAVADAINAAIGHNDAQTDEVAT